MNEVLAAAALHPEDEAAIEWIALQAEAPPTTVRRVLEALGDWRRNTARIGPEAHGDPAALDWRGILGFSPDETPTYGEIEERRLRYGSGAVVNRAASAAVQWRNARGWPGQFFARPGK